MYLQVLAIGENYAISKYCLRLHKYECQRKRLLLEMSF